MYKTMSSSFFVNLNNIHFSKYLRIAKVINMYSFRLSNLRMNEFRAKFLYVLLSLCYALCFNSTKQKVNSLAE